jgi:hypothetical protein
MFAFIRPTLQLLLLFRSINRFNRTRYVRLPIIVQRQQRWNAHLLQYCYTYRLFLRLSTVLFPVSFLIDWLAHGAS